MVTNGNGEPQPSSKSVSKRRYRSALEWRQIVEETLQPGASVAIIARAHEVNANQVFCWRKRYREGLLVSRKNATELVPVRISDSVPGEGVKPSKKEVVITSGAILIEFGNARVRIEGAADPASIRAALDSLRQ